MKIGNDIIELREIEWTNKEGIMMAANQVNVFL
jgi:hypothetical protein